MHLELLQIFALLVTALVAIRLFSGHAVFGTEELFDPGLEGHGLERQA